MRIILWESNPQALMSVGFSVWCVYHFTKYRILWLLLSLPPGMDSNHLSQKPKFCALTFRWNCILWLRFHENESNSNNLFIVLPGVIVRIKGLEPLRISPPDSKSGAYYQFRHIRINFYHYTLIARTNILTIHASTPLYLPLGRAKTYHTNKHLVHYFQINIVTVILCL